MKIETSRLIIRALTQEEMIKYILNDYSLETSLKLFHSPREIDGHVKNAIENNILPKLMDLSKDYLCYTFWTIIDKKLNCMVGDICFKGEPNESGEMEIGYGTYANFQQNGYMTEAVGALAQWAFNHYSIQAIVAETSNDNIASTKVLEKNNFYLNRQTKDCSYWRLDLK